MYRFYKITLRDDGSENAQRDDFADVIQAEGAFEVQKGLAMESNKLTFLMLLDNIGDIHDGYIAKIGEGTFKPRLYEVKITDVETPKTYPHDDVNGAQADYYKRLGGAKQDTSVIAEILRIIDENGNPIDHIYWTRPVEVPDPQAE